VRGDLNNDRYANITDVTYLINSLMKGETVWTMDVNCDGRVNISDVTALINYLLSGDWPWPEYQGPPIPDNAVIYDVNGYPLVMVPVEGGTFMMGSDTQNEGASPIHQVTLSGYSIGMTEVTMGLWKAVTGSYPGWFSPSMDNDATPVWFCSWDTAKEFIGALNELTGMDFRLPSEAQWEFAARGGNMSHGFTYSGSDDLNEVAWYDGNSDGGIRHEVGLKKPNELGLYDMTGSISEFCEDDYYFYSSEPQVDPVVITGQFMPKKVRRGGSYDSIGAYCTVTTRWLGNAYAAHGVNIMDAGFRLAL
jgi:formylglycine-generating enzyme required for sulfatase activity